MTYTYKNYSKKSNSYQQEKENRKANQVPQEMISISMRDNRIGCFSESGLYNRSFFYNSTIDGCLKELELVLDRIQDNEDGLEDTIKVIFIPDTIIALITGLGNYIRLGKTSGGTILAKETIDSFIRIQQKIQAKSFNLNVRSYKMCPNEFGQKAKTFLQEECKNANAEKDGVERITINNSTNSAVAKLQKQIEAAIDAEDWDKVDRLTIMFERLSSKNNSQSNTGSEEVEGCDEDDLSAMEG